MSSGGRQVTLPPAHFAPDRTLVFRREAAKGKSWFVLGPLGIWYEPWGGCTYRSAGHPSSSGLDGSAVIRMWAQW